MALASKDVEAVARLLCGCSRRSVTWPSSSAVAPKSKKFFGSRFEPPAAIAPTKSSAAAPSTAPFYRGEASAHDSPPRRHHATADPALATALWRRAVVMAGLDALDGFEFNYAR
jgi:hypothetical protein